MSHNHFSTTEMTKFYDSIHSPALQKPVFPVPKQPVDANNATCLRLENLSQKSKPLHPFTRPPPPFLLKFPTAELGATASPTFPLPLLRDLSASAPFQPFQPHTSRSGYSSPHSLYHPQSRPITFTSTKLSQPARRLFSEPPSPPILTRSVPGGGGSLLSASLYLQPP